MTEDEVRGIEAIARVRATGTLYDLFELRPSATEAEVEAAYHAFARVWHPDRFYSRDTGALGGVIEENFVEATRAFRTLRDPSKRAAYHREAGIVVAGPSAEPRKPAAASAAAVPAASAARRPVPKAAPPPPPPPPPKPKAPPAIERIRQQVVEQLAKARQYYVAGKEDYDGGRFSKAEAALYLAVQFDPKNQEYAELLKKAVQRAREGKAKGYIIQAEQEESYQRVKEAISWYSKAVECDPPEGVAWYRLGMLLRNHENDERGAVHHLRKAVQKEPQNVAYRMALAEIYESHGLAANALREVNAALAVDPKHEAAKAMAKRLKR